MTATEALDQLIDTGKATPEAQEVLFAAGLMCWTAAHGWTSTATGRAALERRRTARASSHDLSSSNTSILVDGSGPVR